MEGSRRVRRRPPSSGAAGSPARARSDLGARIVAAVPAVAFAIFIVSEGGWIFALGAFALACAAMHELYAMLAAWRPVRLAGFIGAAGIAVAAVDGTPFHVLLAAVAVVPVLFVMVVARPPSDDGATNTLAVAATLLGVYWIGLAIGHAIMLRELPHGDGILIDVLVGTFLGDTGAYLGGRAFGRRRLAARLSPNKTVEGLALGVLTAIASVWFAGLYQDWLPGSDALLIGLGVAIAAPLGDLFESMVKRDAGTKDTGTLFGAHGGALDRLDAVLFSLPVGFYIWTALL